MQIEFIWQVNMYHFTGFYFSLFLVDLFAEFAARFSQRHEAPKRGFSRVLANLIPFPLLDPPPPLTPPLINVNCGLQGFLYTVLTGTIDNFSRLMN